MNVRDAQLDVVSSGMEETEFRCPGDRHSISRAVHLARLSSGHVACRTCEHRVATGSLPGVVVQRLREIPREPTFVMNVDEGIRALSVNELTRERIERIVLDLLDQVDAERRREWSASTSSVSPLKVVIGQDRRPDSPDLMVGVVQALRQSSVEILDAGELSRPAFDFAVDRYRPDIGLFVTGGNRPVGWNGLDIVDSAGLPWLTRERQERFATARNFPPVRLSRTAGRYQVVNVTKDYETILGNLFHALRPLRIGIDCPDPSLRQVLQTILEETPCDARFVQGGFPFCTETRTKPLSDLICEFHLDLGVVFSQDGRGGEFLDETGASLSSHQLAHLFFHQYPDLTSEEQQQTLELTQADLDERTRRERQMEAKLPFMIESSGRCWFLGESPSCNMIQTFARVLEVLSLSERPLSWMARAE